MSEFNYWLEKYKQGKVKQLQRLRKVLPKIHLGQIKSGLENYWHKTQKINSRISEAFFPTIKWFLDLLQVFLAK